MAKPKPHYFCEACGAQVDKWDIQCPHCGKQFDSIKCPQCGYSGHAQEFSNGCPSCGFMSEEQKAAAADRKNPNAKGRTFSLRRPSLLDFRSVRTSLTPAAVNGINLIRVDFGYHIPFHFQSRCQLNADAERMLQQNKSADTLEAPEPF